MIVGIANPKYIEKHKNLHPEYDVKDFDLLTDILNQSSQVIFTPHVLTETSNRLRQIKNPMKDEISHVFKEIIHSNDEKIVISKAAASRPEYIRLGLTDAVLLEIGTTGATLLTADLDLYVAAVTADLKAANFNHIREQRRDDFH